MVEGLKYRWQRRAETNPPRRHRGAKYGAALMIAAKAILTPAAIADDSQLEIHRTRDVIPATTIVTFPKTHYIDTVPSPPSGGRLTIPEFGVETESEEVKGTFERIIEQGDTTFIVVKQHKPDDGQENDSYILSFWDEEGNENNSRGNVRGWADKLKFGQIISFKVPIGVVAPEYGRSFIRNELRRNNDLIAAISTLADVVDSNRISLTKQEPGFPLDRYLMTDIYSVNDMPAQGHNGFDTESAS